MRQTQTQTQTVWEFAFGFDENTERCRRIQVLLQLDFCWIVWF